MSELKQTTRVCCLVTFQRLLALGWALQNELSALWGHFCRICLYSVYLVTDLLGKVTHGWLWGCFFLLSSFSLLPCFPFPLFPQCGLQVWAATSRRQSPFYQWHCDWGWDYGGSESALAWCCAHEQSGARDWIWCCRYVAKGLAAPHYLQNSACGFANP